MGHSHGVGDKLQVFYVEDEAVNVLVMEALFRHRPDLQLIVAHSATNAMDIAAGLKPSLLLLDLRLPDGHGSQLLPRLRSRGGWHEVPAVAVTGESDFDPSGTGFLEVWHKPLDLAWVLARVDALLRSDDPASTAAPVGHRSAVG